MKKIVFVLMMLAVTLNLKAQVTDTTDEKTANIATAHLKYENIEIDGVLTDFMHKLNGLGYKNAGIEKGVGILTANIMGCKNAIVNAASSHANTNVYAVSICYSFTQKQADLENNYQEIIEMITKNYGKAVAQDDGSFSEFIYPGYENGWKNVKLIKNCKFETEYGFIKLAIFQRNIYTLNIVYVDAVNYKKALKERMQTK